MKSPSRNLLLVGRAASRRTLLLREALERRGIALQVIEWRDLAVRPSVLATALARHHPLACKIDSPGEDAATTDRLITLGWQRRGEPGVRPHPLQHGELSFRHWWYAGFAHVLAGVSQALRGSAPVPPLVNSVDGILAMTDKWRCQQRLAEAGVPVPPLAGRVVSFDQLESDYPATRWPRLFIKARYGSSAAGVVALQRRPDGRVSAMSATRLGPHGRLFNHLRPALYRRRADIAALVDRLAAQEAYAEAWITKPRTPDAAGSHYDLRAVVFGGRVRQRVARLSRGAVTNLHLGNARAAPDWLCAGREARMARAGEQAASAFPACHSIGLDLIVDHRGAHVLEANAFGDLLPGLCYEGNSTYDDQAAWMTAHG
ncbi:STM4014 family protein [Tahibacter amnicola]|uniref:STM4014 family protein n=1 Tax=Tahibacter amnicola TaxID=2976241 RepID=A0ABY6BHF3_9GAMM|nr:STM4014 family protein [Tahibacter amnicola]UXI69456.1 STM4014 family protein [Tahibacter amnicola]